MVDLVGVDVDFVDMVVVWELVDFFNDEFLVVEKFVLNDGV